MATVYNNPLLKDFRGSIGNIVFRQVYGKTIVSGKSMPRKQSNLQRENRRKFKCASAYAKSSMIDPEKKKYYTHKAKKLNLPNAYTAALTEYMRNGEIREIDTRLYKRQAGNVILIKAQKKDFGVRSVEVQLVSDTGIIFETGVTFKRDKDVFIYKTSTTLPQKTHVLLRATIRGYSAIMKEVVVN